MNQSEMKLTAENQVKTRTAGEIEAVVKAIDTHVDNVNVCAFGCGALCNMTLNGINTDKTQNKVK